jgi:hypothetical protein
MVNGAQECHCVVENVAVWLAPQQGAIMIMGQKHSLVGVEYGGWATA